MHDSQGIPDMPVEKPWIIILSRARLWPIDNGMKTRVHALAQALRSEYQVCISSVDQPGPDVDCSEPYYEHILPSTPLTRVSRYSRIRAVLNPVLCCGRIPRLPKRALEVNVGQAQAVMRWAKGKVVHAVVSEYIHTVATGRIVADDLSVPLYLDMHDIRHCRVANQDPDKVGTKAYQKLREQDVACWRLADHLLAIQPSEAAYVTCNAPHPSLLVVEHAFPAVQLTEPDENIPKRLLCVASKAAPNVHGLRWFFEHVWSILHEKDPEISVEIVGSCRDALREFTHLSNVTFQGRVEDVAAYYARASLVINPVLYGSGLKIKTVEALAYGKCLVTTPVGAQGLENEADRSYLLAEPEQFGEITLTALQDQDLRKRIEKNALYLYTQRFSPDVCYAGLLNHLRSVHEPSAG